MASETTTTTANDVMFAAWVTSEILNENRPYNVMRPFFREEGRQSSNAYDFPIQADPGASASYTEGTGLSNTALSTDKATATAGTFGMMCTVTDELEEIAVINALPHFSQVIGRSTLEKFETDACALLDDFANTTNTAGVAMSYSSLLEATNQLATRDQEGQAVIVLDPVEVGEVRQDIGTTGAAAFANSAMSAVVGGSQAETLSGYAGFNVGGVPVYQTSLVTSTGGAAFLAGVALGLYMIRDARIEFERDASLPGTEAVSTIRYGMVEIRDVAGETILS